MVIQLGFRADFLINDNPLLRMLLIIRAKSQNAGDVNDGNCLKIRQSFCLNGELTLNLALNRNGSTRERHNRDNAPNKVKQQTNTCSMLLNQLTPFFQCCLMSQKDLLIRFSANVCKFG